MRETNDFSGIEIKSSDLNIFPGSLDIKSVQNFCTELMSKEPEKIFKSIDSISISEKSLISFIQHENFQMSE